MATSMTRSPVESQLPEIQVTLREMKEVEGILFFADVLLDFGRYTVTIHGCTIRDGDKGLWASLPQRRGKKQDQEGKDKYFNVVSLDRELWEAVLARLRETAARRLGREAETRV